MSISEWLVSVALALVYVATDGPSPRHVFPPPSAHVMAFSAGGIVLEIFNDESGFTAILTPDRAKAGAGKIVTYRRESKKHAWRCTGPGRETVVSPDCG